MKAYLNSLDEVSRRSFMLKAAKSMFGVTLLPYAQSALAAGETSAVVGGGKAKSVIYLYMSGGMSHLDTFDPKEDSDVKGPGDPLPTNADGLKLSSFLPNLAKHGDKMAVVRSMSTKTGVHDQANYIMRTGYTPRGTIVHPSCGPLAQAYLGRRNKTLPDSVNLMCGGGHPAGGYLPPAMSPIPLFNPTTGLENVKYLTDDAQFAKRTDLAKQLDADFQKKYQHKDVKAYNDFYEETMNLLRSEDLKAFDLKQESAETKAAYGTGNFAQGCLLARRLVEHGVRFIEVERGGWDMHNAIGTAMTGTGGDMDRAVAALINDLDKKGLLATTMVVVGSEFGRTPQINPGAGRDHHPRVYSTMFAGGGIKGGTVYGASDAKGYEVADKQASVQDFIATIGYALGVPIGKAIFSPSGRPFTFGDKGKPITEIFA